MTGTSQDPRASLAARALDGEGWILCDGDNCGAVAGLRLEVGDVEARRSGRRQQPVRHQVAGEDKRAVACIHQLCNPQRNQSNRR